MKYWVCFPGYTLIELIGGVLGLVKRSHCAVYLCRMCAVCSRAFSDAMFVRYPNGVVTHVHCAKNRHVCPVTGKLFSTKQSWWQKEENNTVLEAYQTSLSKEKKFKCLYRHRKRQCFVMIQCCVCFIMWVYDMHWGKVLVVLNFAVFQLNLRHLN